MATLDKYRTDVKQLIEKYGHLRSSSQDIETQIIEDEKHDHYQLVHVG
jgi:hypothetical protein